MPTLTSCPSCSKQLKVPDELLGRQVKCPACGTTFTATAAMPPGAPPPAVPPAPEFPPAPGYYDQPPGAYEGAPPSEYPRRRGGGEAVVAPAICLIITAILGILVDLAQIVMAAFMPAPKPDPNLPQWLNDLQQGSHGPAAIAGGAIFAVLSLVVLIAAIQMLRRRTWGFAFAGSIMAMANIGNCCCLLGIPFGIWALMVLNKPEVKSSFQ